MDHRDIAKDTPLVSIRVYPDDAILAKELAIETGMSIAEVLRHALNDLNCKDLLPEKWVWVQEKGCMMANKTYKLAHQEMAHLVTLGWDVKVWNSQRTVKFRVPYAVNPTGTFRLWFKSVCLYWSHQYTRRGTYNALSQGWVEDKDNA